MHFAAYIRGSRGACYVLQLCDVFCGSGGAHVRCKAVKLKGKKTRTYRVARAGRGAGRVRPSPVTPQRTGTGPAGPGHTLALALRPLSELYAMVLSVHTLSPIHGMRLSSSQASALLQASFASSLLRLPSSRPRATATGHSHVVMRPTQLIVPSLSSLAQLPLLLLLPAPIA